MPLFKQRFCVCGFDTVGAGIEPNPVGEFFCPQCGRELTPAKSKGEATTEPETEVEPPAPEEAEGKQPEPED